MCGEPPVRILRVPLRFERQTLPKRLVSLPEAEPVRGTKQPLPLVMPTNLADTVETTHGILARLGQSLQYVHVPAPKYRDDEANYAPLGALLLPEGCGSLSWRYPPRRSRRRPVPHRGHVQDCPRSRNRHRMRLGAPAKPQVS